MANAMSAADFFAIRAPAEGVEQSETNLQLGSYKLQLKKGETPPPFPRQKVRPN